MKNLKDIPRETHQIPIVYTKLFLKGALFGGFLGSMYFFAGPVGYLETEKVLSAAGSRPFSDRFFRKKQKTYAHTNKSRYMCQVEQISKITSMSWI